MSLHRRAAPVAQVLLFILLCCAPATANFTAGRSLYVANDFVNNFRRHVIYVYDAFANGNVAPVRTIQSFRLTAPVNAMGTDQQGNLYVLEGMVGARSFILVFPPNASGPNVPVLRTISGSNTRLEQAEGMSVDAQGRIFVSQNFGLQKGAVLVFAPGANGNVAPVATIVPTPLYQEVWGPAVDVTSVYLTTTSPTSTNLLQYDKTANGAVHARCAMRNPYRFPFPYQNIAQGPSGGPLFVAAQQAVPNAPPAGVVDVYAPCASTPVREIAGSNTRLNYIMGIAVDAKNDLYEIDSPSSAVRIFRTNNQRGNVSPSAVISGANTGLDIPTAIAVGP